MTSQNVENNGAIMPTTEDINVVLNSNPTAQMQLQIQMLSRTVRERDEEIAELKEQLESKKTKAKST